MKNIFKNMLSKQVDDVENQKIVENTPLFLTTNGLNFYIEKLIAEAQQYIIIISPYLKICTRLKELLRERKKAGIKIYIVCRFQDNKDELDGLVTVLKDRKNLHAKCFLSENAAIVGSLNLYDFSQINNDEMGFYCCKNDASSIYDSIYQEVKRIYSVATTISEELPKSSDIELDNQFNSDSSKFSLEIGKKYSFQDLDLHFNFEYKKPSGIKSAQNGSIILFENSKSLYQNKESKGVIYYYGQNTGEGPQKLMYGNKQLYDAYSSANTKIFLFRDYIYDGLYYICQKPFMENDKWIFPISKKND